MTKKTVNTKILKFFNIKNIFIIIITRNIFLYLINIYMNKKKFLSGSFLIASPQLMDPIFYKSVIYLISHRKEGAMGIVINQPIIETKLKNICSSVTSEGLKENFPIKDIPITLGGPVDTKKGFVLHTREFKDETTIKVGQNIFLTSNISILKSIVKGDGPKNSLFALGYAGWTPGQLESEISKNGWLVAPGNPELIFKCRIEERWNKAIKSIGINPNLLNSESGNC